jgi:hypothetical protein
VTEVKEVQPEKVAAAMSVTLLGISTLIILHAMPISGLLTNTG